MAASKTTYPNNQSACIKRRRPAVAHLEAGLRSFDRTMPEEINRLLTDAISDILWTPSPDGDENLAREGVSVEKIERVGNIMIDSLEWVRPKIEKEQTYRKLGLEKQRYSVVTLHRPSNVDDLDLLKNLCGTLLQIADRLPLVFPVHPRTRKNMERAKMNGLLSSAKNLTLTEPLSYRRFMSLVFNSRLAITDSGGIQEETSYLGIPCLTLRPNTERPITVSQGTNQLCTPATLEEKVDGILSRPKRFKCSIDLWDGHTASRIVQSIRKHFNIR
jgi:UDP-N-acetylglucosamine 2-epimerase (non-hydrolysing)